MVDKHRLPRSSCPPTSELSPQLSSFTSPHTLHQHHYSVAKTHRMPKVAGHVSHKEPLFIGLFCPKGAFRRKMTYEDKAPYASTPACTTSPLPTPLVRFLTRPKSRVMQRIGRSQAEYDAYLFETCGVGCLSCLPKGQTAFTTATTGRTYVCIYVCMFVCCNALLCFDLQAPALTQVRWALCGSRLKM